MFIPGNLLILLAVLFLLLIGVLIFSRKLAWFGQLPGDIKPRYPSVRDDERKEMGKARKRLTGEVRRAGA